MGLTWQRSGDPLGDFLRLVFLLEETLERLGAWPEGTLGEKVKAVEGYLAEWGGSGLVRDLWELVRLRNQVVHERKPVSQEALVEGSRVVAELLQLLERQAVFTWPELVERLQVLRRFPPPPEFKETVILPPEARAPEVPPGKRPLEVPRRPWFQRPLALPRRSLGRRGFR